MLLLHCGFTLTQKGRENSTALPLPPGRHYQEAQPFDDNLFIAHSIPPFQHPTKMNVKTVAMALGWVIPRRAKAEWPAQRKNGTTSGSKEQRDTRERAGGLSEGKGSAGRQGGLELNLPTALTLARTAAVPVLAIGACGMHGGVGWLCAGGGVMVNG